MSRSLLMNERRRWDAIVDEEGRKLGLSRCVPFLENKLVNDIFYRGSFNGVDCIVKCSSRAPESIANEYEMSRRLAAVDDCVCAESLALWRSEDGKMAFVVERRLPGPSLTELIAGGAAPDEAVGVLEDMLRIAAALQKSGIVWRDIIPDNFIRDADGHFKLIDAQFAILRDDFREDPYLKARWTYRTLLFAHHPDMAGRGWNDVAMMFHYTRLLPRCDRADELRERLRGMMAGSAFPVEYGLGDDVRMVIYLLGLKLRLPFASSRKKQVLRDRASRASRFLKRRKSW